MNGVSRLPELGPWLGRLAAPPAPQPSGVVPLDDIRLTLATATLDLAGAARDFANGDRAAAVSALRARDWRGAWDRAITEAAARVKSVIDERLARAAAESRYPARKLARAQVSDEERAAIAARLGAGAIPFENAITRLDELAGPASRGGPDGESGFSAWWEGVTDAARRLDTAWSALADAANVEVARWDAEAGRILRWRRPRWPLWILSLAIVAVATWLGLVLGGYLAVPGWLQPFAEWWWRTVTFA